MQFNWTHIINVKGKQYVHLVSPRTGRAYTVRCGPGAQNRVHSRAFRDSQVKVDS